MNLRKTVAMALLALVVTVLWGIGPPQAQATDETKVPHYFGPYANWALSPLPIKNADGSVSGGIRKFVDGLPRLGEQGANNLGQYLPVAVPDTTTYPGSDYYVIGLVQYRQKMHSDLPPTLLRGYVQLATDKVAGNVALSNAMVDGSSTAIAGYSGVTPPNYLGPVIVATKGRPVRILFRNLLPTGAGGDLFLPVDSTMMGSGMGQMMEAYNPAPVAGGDVNDEVRNPMCTGAPKDSANCFADNRTTLHLHGGITPWISDGTPHQWITPADQNTPWPKGVSVKNVPDMPDPGPGAMTFFYTNQQSARLMFYHDHAWGITRLNVYAGEAAGYMITDDAEKALVSAGIIPGPEQTIPLIIQDRTFVPSDDQILKNDLSDPANPKYAQDPTWDKNRWGGFGNLWYHHVYMPAQNPGDPSGVSAYGRWMYGPWFWPPANDTKYGPIANPRYNMDPATKFTTALAKPCNLDDPTSWQYQVDPYCEPELIPGTPNISAGMEQFNDTPVVNGTVYPTTTVDPKPYRLRILNAANDRFFNLQLYVADSGTASSAVNAKGEVIGGTEVALKASELAAAQDDPNVFPTPDTTLSPAGPSWIQIASEGGFLPAPAVIPPRPITWITDPTRFDFGNVDKHSLVLAPAERADVIVDFSKYAGKTIILYNDAPAAYPARVASYDYYTGSPDLSPNGAPGVLPGYGPNTRTIMQIKVNGGPGTPLDLNALKTAFAHHADGSGVFESGQHPIIVGQAAYNSAYGTTFPSASWCNAPGSTKQSCDGFARISEQGGDLFGFNTLASPATKLQIPLQPKAIHDEMNAATFDEFGRMTANMGVEAVPSNPGGQNINLMPYVFPPTEVIDATNLPKGMEITSLGTGTDGTQIWKITHNGVDTHPLHFHLYDVQVLNRVTWDNIIIAPDANELGWKDTVRVSPLEDTIIALRPVIPTLPFDIPNSIRLLNPMQADGAPIALASVMDTQTPGLIPPSNPDGEPIDVYNHKVNFGAEYVWHCHILSHEEMDMMRPVAVALPPVAPGNLLVTASGTGTSRVAKLSWFDNSLSETGWEVQRAVSTAGPWTTIATVDSTTGPTNTETISYSDPIGTDTSSYVYRVRAINVVGDTWNYANPGVNEIGSGGFPTVTATSAFSNTVQWPPTPTLLPPDWVYVAPTKNATSVAISWAGSAVSGVIYVIQEATDSAFTNIVAEKTSPTPGFTFTFVTNGTYHYRVKVTKTGYLDSAWKSAGPCVVTASAPAPPWMYVAPTKSTPDVAISWGTSPIAGVTYVVQESTTSNFTTITGQTSTSGTTFTFTGHTNGTYYYRVKATVPGLLDSTWTYSASCTVNASVPAPTWIYVAPTKNISSVAVSWGASRMAGVAYVLQESTNSSFTTVTGEITTSGTLATFTGRTNGTYYYRVKAIRIGSNDSTWEISTPSTVILP
jgi:FtsP/CotA-like multicopper oxidase with cupredoxin domain